MTPSQQSLSAQFQLLRTRVESCVSGPAVIVVTSAEAGDGASLTAISLAECLAGAGRRTALLFLNDAGNAPLAEPTPGRDQQLARVGVPMPLSIPDGQLSLSRDDLRSFVDSVRSSYEFVVVDAPALLQSHRAMALAELSDGVLLSVRLGRHATDNDHITLEILKQSKGNVIGVVAAYSDAIAKFERSPKQQTKALKSQSAAPKREAGTRRGLVAKIGGSAVCLIIVLASLVAFATLQPGKYKSLAILPEPAKTVVLEIASKFRPSPQ
jgi:hypothetical protein